jgi:hypothetical protein
MIKQTKLKHKLVDKNLIKKDYSKFYPDKLNRHISEDLREYNYSEEEGPLAKEGDKGSTSNSMVQ